MNDNGGDIITESLKQELVEISAEETAYQAKEVGLLLGKDVVKKAWLSTERRITKEWENSDNPLAREMAWHKLHAFKMLRRELQTLADRHLVVDNPLKE